jgi:hypothetical protein
MALAEIRFSIARTQGILVHIRKHLRQHLNSKVRAAEEEDVQQLENIAVLLADLKALVKAYGEKIFAGNASFLSSSLDDYEDLYKITSNAKPRKRWVPVLSTHDLRANIHEKSSIESSKLLVFIIQYALV